MICHLIDCSVDFEPNPRGGHPQIFCSTRCKNLHHGRLRQIRTPISVRIAISKSYYKHHERNKQRSREKYYRNIEKERARSRAYQLSHTYEANVRGRRYARSDKGLAYRNRLDVRKRSREAIRQWYKKHPEKTTEYRHKRRAARYSVPCTLTIEQWQILLEVWYHRCAYCERGNIKLTQDHVVPISRGGAHAMSNVVPACSLCNSKKGTKNVEQFKSKLKG